MFISPPKRLPVQQITSKGCSRGYILCVLYRALDYVRQRHTSGQTVQFPFCHSEIKKWLEAAQVDCSICEESFQAGLGGTPYDDRDPSTYWTQPQQFCTWWKNNVERKNKFLILQRDASYCENTDDKLISRAAYCRNAIAISLSMKNYFYRYLPKERDAKIVQYMIPYTMPQHMTSTATAKPLAQSSNSALLPKIAPITKSNEITWQVEKAFDIISGPNSPPRRPSAAPSTALGVGVLSGNSIGNICGTTHQHSVMNSVTPENKKRKQQQQRGNEEDLEEGEQQGRKLLCSSSDPIHTDRGGSRNLDFLSRLNVLRDDSICSSDSGTDDEGEGYRVRGKSNRYSVQREQRREGTSCGGTTGVKVEPSGDGSGAGQMYGHLKASLSPHTFLPISMDQPYQAAMSTSSSTLKGPGSKMKPSYPILSTLQVDKEEDDSHRLPQFSSMWSSPSNRFIPLSQFSLDRSFDDDLLALLSKSMSSSDLVNNRIPTGSTDMEECLFLSMSVTPVQSSPLSFLSNSSCNTPPVICSPLRAPVSQCATPPIPNRRHVTECNDQQKILSAALANRLSELVSGEYENYANLSYRSSMGSPQFAFSNGTFNRQIADEELTGDRKVRFREVDDVRVIGASPSSARTTGESTPLYCTFEPASYPEMTFSAPEGDSCSFLDDSSTESEGVTRTCTYSVISDGDSATRSLQCNRGQYYYRDRDRMDGNCSSMDTLDCNDLLTMISIINEDDVPSKDRETHASTNINGNCHGYGHHDGTYGILKKEEEEQEKEQEWARVRILSRSEGEVQYNIGSIDRIADRLSEREMGSQYKDDLSTHHYDTDMDNGHDRTFTPVRHVSFDEVIPSCRILPGLI